MWLTLKIRRAIFLDNTFLSQSEIDVKTVKDAIIHKVIEHDTTYKECGVGNARNRGNDPGFGVGVDQTASTPTPDRLLQLDTAMAGQKHFFVTI